MIFTLLNLLAIVLVFTAIQASLPGNYMSLSGKDKQQLQWNEILATQYGSYYNPLPTEFPNANTNATVLTDPVYLTTTFTRTDDEQPPGRNREVIGPFGVVAKVLFRTYQNTSKYTGLFVSGGPGLMRLTLNGLGGTIANFVPLLAMKVYVDGDYSRTFLQVNDLRGQAPNHNFFKSSLSNIIDVSFFSPSNPNWAIALAFINTPPLLPGGPLDRPVNNGNMGQYDSASIYQNGTKVMSEVLHPWESIFVPSPKLVIPADSTRDFRLDIISAVKPGDLMYTVMARATPNSTTLDPIGEVICESPFVASQYGDVVLFFRHPSQQWRPQ